MKVNIYIGKPKYVAILNKHNIIYIGDYIGFKNCYNLASCRILKTKKIDKVNNRVAFWECCYMACNMVTSIGLVNRIKLYLLTKFMRWIYKAKEFELSF